MAIDSLTTVQREFDDPLLAQSALDRLAHNAHQITIEGESYRSRQRPGQPTAT